MTLSGHDAEKIILRDFRAEERERARQTLMTIRREHVMAQSEATLAKTRLAVLQLSGGDIAKLQRYAQCALRDFRDVLHWAAAKTESADAMPHQKADQ